MLLEYVGTKRMFSKQHNREDAFIVCRCACGAEIVIEDATSHHFGLGCDICFDCYRPDELPTRRPMPEWYENGVKILKMRWEDGRSPPIRPCRRCGYPVPDGYVCHTCGWDESGRGRRPTHWPEPPMPPEDESKELET